MSRSLTGLLRELDTKPRANTPEIPAADFLTCFQLQPATNIGHIQLGGQLDIQYGRRRCIVFRFRTWFALQPLRGRFAAQIGGEDR